MMRKLSFIFGFIFVVSTFLIYTAKALGDPPAPAFFVDDRAFIHCWLLRGPFPNQDQKNREVDLLSSEGGENNVFELHNMKTVSFSSFDESAGDQWLPLISKSLRIRLHSILNPSENVVAYAATWVRSEKNRKCLLKVGSDDGIQIWLNGSIIHDNPVYRGLTVDEDAISVNLKKGMNFLLLKNDQGSGDWGFCARFTDFDSEPFTDLEVHLPVRLTEQQVEKHVTDMSNVSCVLTKEDGENVLQFTLNHQPLIAKCEDTIVVRSDVLSPERKKILSVLNESFSANESFEKKKTVQPKEMPSGRYTLHTRFYKHDELLKEESHPIFWSK